MNKKFSTLLMSVLLTGAFTSVDAKTVTVTSAKEFEALIENGLLTGGKDSKLEGGDKLVIKALKNGNYLIPFVNYRNGATGDYVVVDIPNLEIVGEGEPKIVGRLVLTGDDITVSGLTIVNKGLSIDENNPENGDHSLFYNKSAISVLANKVTITQVSDLEYFDEK